jgi:hypothetical protein
MIKARQGIKVLFLEGGMGGENPDGIEGKSFNFLMEPVNVNLHLCRFKKR